MALAAILAAAALLRCWRLDEGGVLVPYYYAGVRSMLQSWHNFFFNAFDPAGFVSIDKPPVAFWLQTASAKLFGFNRDAVLLPQVVTGIGAVGALYWLVRRQFGAGAGLLAALLLAVNPVSVAVDRSNNTESCLTLALLLAVWAFMRAMESGRLRWLLAAAAIVGIGFNIKMLAAFGIAPVFVLVYLALAPSPLPRRLGQLAGAGAVLAVALSWCVAYDLTPADSRPFVDSSSDNSMLELAVGHNFAQRFVRPARMAGNAVAPVAAPDTVQVDADPERPPFRDFAPAGPLRLAAPALAAQIGWFFPLALIGGVAVARRALLGPTATRAAFAVWVGWLLIYGAVFSAAGGLFHAYYLAVMAPPVCAIAAIGTARLWGLRDNGRPGALLLPVAIVVTALWQARIVGYYLGNSLSAELGWLAPALAGVALLAAGGLLVFGRRRRIAVVCAATGIAVLLVLPLGWSIGTAVATVGAGFPSARPPFLTQEAQNRRGRFNMIAGAIVGDPKLIAFLEQNRGGATYLLAAVNARLAAPIIIATGAPVMALGGFNGRAPILGAEDFARLVAAGRVRFALIGDGSPGLRRVFGEGGQQALVDWVRGNGRLVDPAEWRSPAAWRTNPSAEAVGVELYDLHSAQPGS